MVMGKNCFLLLFMAFLIFCFRFISIKEFMNEEEKDDSGEKKAELAFGIIDK